MKLGVVSFLNARPLIEGLADDPRTEIVFDTPANLAERLDRGEVDAALVPIIDVIRRADEWRVVSDACIACDGETMTVRVFSQVPPDRIRKLWVDHDSHTSVALAVVLWRELFDVTLEPIAFNARAGVAEGCEAVLLIGDKVVDRRRGKWAYEIDLGGAWKQHTGLPFVFAVWAAKRSEEYRVANRELGHSSSNSGCESAPSSTRYSLLAILNSARDRGLAKLEEIAADQGPSLGWPVALARRYLIDCLRYRLDEHFIEGAERYAELAAAVGMAPGSAAIAWPRTVDCAASKAD